MTGLDVFFRYSKKPLPYDAEVEYLQSTGGQLIDTGVYPETANTVRFKVRLPLSGRWSNPFTAYVAENAPATRIIINNYYTNNQAIIYDGVYAGNFVPGGTLVQGDASRIFEGWMDGPSARAVVNSRSYSLNARPLVARIGATMKVLSSPYSGARVYYLAIDNQFDLIPVRFTNDNNQTEGAMYDKVTKRMFRNQGTGAFVIGPDK